MPLIPLCLTELQRYKTGRASPSIIPAVLPDMIDDLRDFLPQLNMISNARNGFAINKAMTTTLRGSTVSDLIMLNI